MSGFNTSALNHVFPQSREYTVWAKSKRLISHVLQMAECLKQTKLYFTEAAYLFSRAGYFLYKNAQYSQASLLYEHVRLVWQELLGVESLNFANCLNSLVEIYDAQGKYVEARSLALVAIEVAEKYQDDSPEVFSNSLFNLALLDESEKNYKQAKSHFFKALRIQKRLLGKQTLEVAKTLNSLANVCAELEEYRKAEILYKEALNIQEKLLGSNSLESAEVASNLGLLYVEQNRFDDGERLLHNSIRIRKKS